MFTNLLSNENIWYERKSWTEISKIQKNKLKCASPGCNELLSLYKGPGANKLCRDHQLKLSEYGGTGRLDRLHTLHRKWICDDCGTDVSKAVKDKFPNLETTEPELFNRLCRARIIGDHQIRKSDGGSDAESNIRSLCLNCNADKTIINKDYLKGTKGKTK